MNRKLGAAAFAMTLTPVTWLGIGYVITRGLAKSGSYQTFTRDRDR